MRITVPLSLIGLSLIAGGLTWRLKHSSPPHKPLNVILISVDTLRRSELHPYNPDAATLPALRKLSHESMVFENAYTTAPWTLPAHGSMFTGTYPDRHGAVNPAKKISGQIPTLAELLRANGYATAAFTGGVYVSKVFGLNRGFFSFNGRKTPGDKSEAGKVWPAVAFRNEKSRDKRGMLTRGEEFIETWADPKRPFFLFLHTYVVHDYFRQHPWALKHLPDPPKGVTSDLLSCLVGKQSCSDQDWDWLHRLYRAELLRMDQGLRIILQALERKGLADSTLIVLVSDHGEGFRPKEGRIHHGGRLNEDLIRIPMMIAGPGIDPGRSQMPVSLVDVTPTILELAGVSAKARFDGVSLVPELHGQKEYKPRPLYAMEYFHQWEGGRRVNVYHHTDTPLMEAVMYEEGWYIQQGEKKQFYWMDDDPLQTVNLAPTARAAGEYAQLLNLRQGVTPTSEPATMSKAIVGELKSLGYIQ